MRARLRAADGALINAIAFRAVGKTLGQALMKRRGEAMHVAGTLCLDRRQGGERVQLRISDLAPAVGD